jgi:hypothetical protein
MTPNSLGSENLAVLATLDPVSQAAATVTTGWVDARKFAMITAMIATGVLGASATLDAKLQQASDSSGTGAKDITGKAITQIVKASGDNKQAFINVRPEDLDVDNSFAFVRLSVTVGTAASLIFAGLFGLFPRQGTASDSNQAGVVQIVS